jgi:Leucine-rich repeat (LRR) protein
MNALQGLCIQMKNLKKIPDDIFKLKNLELLEIEDCEMKDLPDCLSEMKSLKNFGLINNRLEKISK